MGLKVGIFEDDKELADFLKELLEENGFSVSLHYGLKENSWRNSDVVLGDFRNEIVNFETLRVSCVQLGIPLIAISGAETTYTPQLLKPFTIAEMQAAILQQMIATPRNAKSNARKSS
jgi:DNA-binding response OmpR family regulator